MPYERKHRKRLLRKALNHLSKARKYWLTFFRLSDKEEEQEALYPFSKTVKSAFERLHESLSFLLSFSILYKKGRPPREG